MAKPLWTEENYAEKLQIYKNQSDTNVEKTYWDYFKQFTKDNTKFQELGMNDFPIYIPTQEDKNDPYFKSLFDKVDLSTLEQLEA